MGNAFLKHPGNGEPPKKRPHIVYFHSHDTGRYVQPYGYQVSTPWLQRMAEEGVTYRRAFSVAPTCSPSRAGLMTGCAAHSVGMLGLAHKGYRLHDPAHTLIRVLGDAGYHTVLCGGQHIAPHHEIVHLGYTETPATMLNPTAAHAADNALAFLDRWDGSAPFFLDMGAFETHRHQAKDDSVGSFHSNHPQGDPRYIRPPEPIPDTPPARADWADFCHAAARWDTALGRIYQDLEHRGLLDNTLFICTTDHGPPLPDMKCTLKDFGTQVTLILRGPGGFRGGKIHDELVSQTDLLPTLCELIGRQTPTWVQGRSFLAASRDGSAHRESVFAEINYHGPYNPQRSVRTASHKLICRLPDGETGRLLFCDPSGVKDSFAAAGWERYADTNVQLYDLRIDPQECRNLAALPESRDLLQSLMAQLATWMEATNDPLYEGFLALNGAIMPSETAANRTGHRTTPCPV